MCRFLLPPAEEVGATGEAADAGKGGVGGPCAGGGVADALAVGELLEVDGKVGFPAFGGGGGFYWHLVEMKKRGVMGLIKLIGAMFAVAVGGRVVFWAAGRKTIW